MDYVAVIDRVVKDLEGVTSHTEAAAIVGVGEATMRRWRDGDRAPPRKRAIQAALEGYAARVGMEAGPAAAPPDTPILKAIQRARTALEEVERLAKERPTIKPASPSPRRLDSGRVQKVEDTTHRTD